MCLDSTDYETFAMGAQRRSGMFGLARIRPTSIATACDVGIEFDAPDGVDGWYEEATNTIHIHPRLRDQLVQGLVLHEFVHNLLTEHGIRKAEQERHVSVVGSFVRAPYPSVRRQVKRHGFDPQFLLSFFRFDGSPGELLWRCAEACADTVSVIVHSATGAVFTGGGRCNTEAEEKEILALVRKARRTGEIQPGPFGVHVYPYRHSVDRGAAVVTYLDRCLSYDCEEYLSW
jgi:hypothetical protein